MNRPGILDTRQALDITPFVLNGGQATARAVTASWVVEHFNVIEHIAFSSLSGWIDTLLDSLSLEELEEAFSNSIVVTVAPAAHASLQVIGLQKTLPIQAAELTTLIRMNHDGLLGLPPPDGGQQGIQCQICGHARLHRPSHHLPRKQVDHYRQVEPALVSADVSDVGDPCNVGCRYVKLTIQVVR